MAKFEKRKSGWLARVRKKGIDQARTFDTKKEAAEWASSLERKIDEYGKNADEVARHRLSRKTLRETFVRYVDEVSPRKKGRETALRENQRFQQMATSQNHSPLPDLMDKPISSIKSFHIAEWKMTRLSTVKESSVAREKNFLCNVFTMAREWGYIEESPLSSVKFSDDRSASRDRRVSEEEIKQVLFALDHWEDHKVPETPAQTVALLWKLCIETAMRQQEVKYLVASEIDFDNRVINLAAERTKEKKKKTLALSSEAVRLLNLGKADDDYWFASSKLNVSSIFSIAVRKALINDLEFRDSRHEALTRLSEKLTPFELAKQAGHTDMNRTLKYFRKTAKDFSCKLA